MLPVLYGSLFLLSMVVTLFILGCSVLACTGNYRVNEFVARYQREVNGALLACVSVMILVAAASWGS